VILSGADVRQYIAYGGLRFSPELQDDQFQQNGVDLILGKVEASQRGTGELYPGEFVLGCTLERIEMPNDLMAFVQLRSTWARRGFMLPPTVIDAGFRGQITLEIVSFAHNMLPLQERFAHLIFAKLASPSEPYAGKYQEQMGITKAAQ
jgi:dCTP deaminase